MLNGSDWLVSQSRICRHVAPSNASISTATCSRCLLCCHRDRLHSETHHTRTLFSCHTTHASVHSSRARGWEVRRARGYGACMRTHSSFVTSGPDHMTDGARCAHLPAVCDDRAWAGVRLDAVQEAEQQVTCTDRTLVEKQVFIQSS